MAASKFLEDLEAHISKPEDYLNPSRTTYELGGNAEGTKRALYDDFFDAPEDAEEVKSDGTRSSRQAKKRNRERRV